MSSNSPKQSRSGGDHGYGYGGGSSGYGGYGGYGYGGYGYGGYGYGYGSKREGGLQRSLQDYLLILRERIWYIIVVFLVVFSSALVYTLGQQKVYRAMTTMQVYRRAPSTTGKQGDQVMSTANDVTSADDLNTILSVFTSASVLEQVVPQISGNDLRQFMAPYDVGGSTTGVPDILNDNRRVALRRGTLVLEVTYSHPDPVVAAKVSNLFAESYIAYRKKKNIEANVQSAGDLQITVKSETEKVDRKNQEISDFRSKHGLAVAGGNYDLINANRQVLNTNEVSARVQLSAAETRAQQIEKQLKEGKKLTDLSYFSNHPAIAPLIQRIRETNILISQLSEKYGDLWPDLKTAKRTLATTQTELDSAVDSAVKQYDSEYATYRSTWEKAKNAVDAADTEAKNLDALKKDYEQMTRDFALMNKSLEDHKQRLEEIKNAPSLELDQVVMMDTAKPPPMEAFVSPNYTVNLSLGVAAGLGLGLVFAFFVAYIDDRVKSSFDIESVVGLPLIGIIPAIKKMEQPDKAQVVANNADRQVSEAFLALHSALRLKDESKNAQCILTTSTIPGEGKSFVSTNLALTFAAHGERVLIIDCDLRKPNVHKSFRQENLKGVIDVIAGAATIDDVTIKQLHPNLDVMTSGGRAKNPTQILNSKKFEIMVSELRKRYDRIFFDTPPLAAVSDALIILPLMDGSLFSIFFNKVRRKAAQFAAKKLLEANVPVYGAILNGLNLAVSGYYYAQYYDKSYKDYYVVMSKGDGNAPAAAASKPPADE